MSREIDLTKEEQSLLLDVLFRQNYASEILSVELSDIENGRKKADVSHYKQITSLFARLKNEGY
ncbi:MULTISPECIES: antirepressor AbbA [unclassified Bacillus (in: firmicutes)]|uniref:antirepressor AbbA n=1 Tax=unclassified Bacillus (in: firmicutes) TaxID=185979 RepID=UPI00232F00E7|nr:antirepressor AbbA [Bacillus sp. BP-3]MDC2864879.1 antirepressor AbbA [Bacillus sp. BP-3]